MGGVGRPKDGFATPSVRKCRSPANNEQPQGIGTSLDQEFSESELKYRTLIETLPHAIIIVENGNITFANDAAAELLGLKRSEYLIGRDPFEFVAESEKARLREYCQRRIADEPGVPEQYETVARHHNGQEIPVQVGTRTLDFPGHTAFQLVVTDLTERRRSATWLRLLAGALEQMAEGMAIVDLEGRILFLNQYLGTMHGYRSEELVGKHVAVLYPPEELMSLAAANRETWRWGASAGEFIHRRKDSTTMPVFRTSSLLRNGQDSPIGTILTVRDIPELKVSEQIALHSAEKSRQHIQNLEERLRTTAERLEDSQTEQKNYTTLLEQANEALKLVIRETENRNRQREQDVYRSLSTRVFPIVDQLKAESLPDSVRILLDALEFNLKSLFVLPPKAFHHETMRLTPQETRVSELLLSGLTSKQIADAMGISSATVVVHRTNIRKKLGLIGSDQNLTAYLRSKLQDAQQ